MSILALDHGVLKLLSERDHGPQRCIRTDHLSDGGHMGTGNEPIYLSAVQPGRSGRLADYATRASSGGIQRSVTHLGDLQTGPKIIIVADSDIKNKRPR